MHIRNVIPRFPIVGAGLATAVAVFLAAAPAAAQSFEKAQQSISGRLQRSLSELSDVRQEIAREKIPLSKSVARLEDQVAELRREKSRLIKTLDSSTLDLGTLRKRVDALEDQSDFVDSRLGEFVRDFESRLDISEVSRFEGLTGAAKLADKNVNLDALGKRQAQVDVVSAALDRLERQIGGYVFDGEALSPEGVLTQGRFVSFGPTVFYASEDGAVTGLVENQLNQADPVVVDLPGELDAGIAAITQGGSGTLPLDATLGKALKVEKARKSLFSYVEDGGAVGYVILGLGAAALLLTAFKCIEILGFKTADPKDVDGILDDLAAGKPDAAAARANDIEGVAGEMLTVGVENADAKRGLLEELLFEHILRVRPVLERYLPFLAITAAASPLLGLLGTVIGMIKTFQLITIFGTGDAKSLSSGISEALVTTALGLVVAIPTLILHGALSRMAKRKLGLLEELSVAFVNGTSSIRKRGARNSPTPPIAPSVPPSQPTATMTTAPQAPGTSGYSAQHYRDV